MLQVSSGKVADSVQVSSGKVADNVQVSSGKGGGSRVVEHTIIMDHTTCKCASKRHGGRAVVGVGV